ncbi:biopolymer transport protein ExbD [Flavobacterium arsenatis]|uniref:Biopolymer transport protein ExbD n=1 Tax=Flavobacterium arsenatis TaxID=1484332 RepID=A0ABU1TLL1_9FLAO|nr:biopolymer transporter ExbD [Flavobacterium arsenatis]MDR6966855.1 biopolymer transport protein ExbD [Flavobacterium arsenatis]
MNLRGRNRINAEFNMSSMTDIVFLLLIFFMIAVTTMTTTNALDLVLPNSDGKADEVETVAVSVDEKLNYYIDKQQYPEEELENALKTLLADQKEPNVVLNVAKGVPIENAVKVMDIAYRNKFKIVLAVAPK